MSDGVGWIKLHRSLLDWEWIDESSTLAIFLHCLLMANHKGKKWRGIVIERGQFMTSLASLSAQTGLSIRKIRTALKKLESTGEVTSKRQARGRVISVVEYDKYQCDDRVVTSKRQSDDNLMTGKRQASDNKQECKNVKNVKNEKNVKNKTGISKNVDVVIAGLINPISWDEFVAHRKKIKKPLNDLSAQKSLDILINLNWQDQKATIDKSIQSSWAGLFPNAKQTKQQGAMDSNTESHDRLFGSSNIYEGTFNEH